MSKIKYPYYENKKVKSVKEILELQLNNNPNLVAFSYREKDKIIDKTFKEVYEDSINLSNYFYNNYKNEKIALIGENSYNWMILFFGIILSGNICVSIDKDIDEDLLNKLLKQVDCNNVYYSKSYVTSIDKVKVNKLLIEDTKEYIEKGKKLKNKYKTDYEKDALILFTSGTTGPNKAVVLTEKNICSDSYSASSMYKVPGDSVMMLPNHHAFGLLAGTLMPFYQGKRVFLNSSLRYMMKDIKEIKPKMLLGVPMVIETFYKQIFKTVKAQHKEKILKLSIIFSNLLLKIGIDLRKKLFKDILNSFGGNLENIIYGGAYLDYKYIKFFKSIGITIISGYGITECSPVVSLTRNLYQRKESIGLPCRDVEVKIIDGEICIKSDIVMKGYYKDQESTNKVIIDGYFHTGDLGYIDKDGFLYITGRIKNLIILSNGENISPELIENELSKDENIEEVIIFEEDNKIIASIFPSEDYIGNQEYFDNLIHKYNEDKPINKQITKVLLRDKEHIKNNNKKILRNKVKEGE